MPDFIHLHNHTHYSLQDGACKVKSLIQAAKNFGMKAVALTDHGVLYGVPEFYKEANYAGIKPIIGMEAYIVKDGSRFDRKKNDELLPDNRKRKHYNHLILLAKNLTGYKNLVKLSSFGFLEGFYYKPRIDIELLQKYNEGIICTSACIGGIVASELVEGNYQKAKARAKEFKDIFGDDFYLEIQNHNLSEEKPVLTGMPKIAKELGIKLIATNDCHYIKKEDAYSHNILLLLSDKSGEADYTKLRYGTDQIYFKSKEEMIALFPNHPEALDNTLEIESKINLDLSNKINHFPVFPIPSESKAQDLDEYVEELARAGLNKRYDSITPEIEERFNFELSTIKKMGFSGYFLIVQDFINASKMRNIPVGPGRGSAAGSLVAYTLGITNVDPLEYDLLFERFLNPARKSMPDIDVDFADDQRGEVIDYVKEKYGTECVSQIITFNTLSSKAVIRDVARVLKIPIPTVNNITKFIPSKFGKVFSIEQSLNEVPELKWVKDSTDSQIKNLITHAKVLEGMNRNASKHAAGVVIAPGEVSDFVPLSCPSQDEVVTQYNMKELENFGLLKMDFLGLRTLTIIKDTIELIKKNHSIEIDVDRDIKDYDEKTYLLFAKGQTTGVFQFESPPMREYLKRLKPTSIKDLAAMNALYRPGPMEFIDDFIERKYGRKPIEYLHPVLEPILKETYGIIVYQEQVIQIANKAGGMSLAEADLLRRAMGKKDLIVMQQQRDKFIEGAQKANNIPEKIAIEIFNAIDKFANYGFNKSHAVAYSVIAYQTAYLKAHYTPEFLAANLKNEFGSQDKVTKFLEDCRKLKIKVLPPNINKPSVYFDVEKGKIRFGLSAIKNVGVNAIEEIKKSREKLGRNFKSIFEFCSNVDTRLVNKRALEGLIIAGAFDTVSKNRAQLFMAVEQALEFGSKVSEYKKQNSESLFGFDDNEIGLLEPPLPTTNDWSENERLFKEREFIGFYVSGHPLQKYEIEYRSFSTIHLGETEEVTESSKVRICGVLADIQTKIDKSGKTMAFFKLDDFTGFCDCIMFSKVFSKFEDFIMPEACVVALGLLESSGDAVKLNIEEIIPIEKSRERFTKYLKIVFDSERLEPAKIFDLKRVLNNNPGNFPVILELINNGSKPRLFHLKNFKVKLANSFLNEIQKLLGEESVLFIPK